MAKQKFIILKHVHNPVGTWLQLSNGTTVGFYTSPTANCQVGAYCSFAAIFTLPDAETRKKALMCLFGHARNNLAIIDVKQLQEDSVEEIFPKNLTVFKTKYNSTNGSKMIIIMVNTCELSKMYNDAVAKREDKTKNLYTIEQVKHPTNPLVMQTTKYIYEL